MSAISNMAQCVKSSTKRSTAVSRFNQASEAIFGYRADEIVGSNVSLLMPEQQANAHDGPLLFQLEDGQDYTRITQEQLPEPESERPCPREIAGLVSLAPNP